LSKSCSDPKDENTIDFYLSATRNTATAKRFLGKALQGLKNWEKPRIINTDLRSADLRRRPRRAEAGGQVPGGDATPTGQVSEQRHRSRSR